ncbi:hypothetical protein HDV06_001425 [Boothiomyces sp. JEL0866]|nr:hypothetical protein HDV06_001425 [Boothiomyces sp. JEL0866]
MNNQSSISQKLDSDKAELFKQESRIARNVLKICNTKLYNELPFETKQQEFKDTCYAIKQIVVQKLYRCMSSSLEGYFKKRWNVSRASTYRFLECATILSELSDLPIIPHKERICRQLKACVGFNRENLRNLWQQILDTTGGDESHLNCINIEDYTEKKSITHRKPKRFAEQYSSSSEDEILPRKARKFSDVSDITPPRDPTDDLVRNTWNQYLSSFENILSHGYKLETKIKGKWVEAERWGIMAVDTQEVYEFPHSSLDHLLRAAELAYANIR